MHCYHYFVLSLLLLLVVVVVEVVVVCLLLLLVPRRTAPARSRWSGQRAGSPPPATSGPPIGLQNSQPEKLCF